MTTSGPARRVLVVDDASSVRFLLRSVLEHAGIEVEEAASAAAALERLEAATRPPVAAVVVDQRMPDMTGLDMARSLRARGAHPRLFLFTGQLSPREEEQARELGVTPLLKSGLDELVDELVGAVDAVAA